ncbi:hypothetical protein QTG54_004712 [Skeletonema marinoi]|uniref:Uncharacterized protein n=1 Tax=Skeletonema marinoi TaxID=267567 RepID=A0AAD9DFF0_9STRA|nr:hypothetical protein QTG54_004712 [Skeletonema marinoi]
MRSKKSRLNDSDSSTAPKRRKGKTSTDDHAGANVSLGLMREFVSAIFDVGLKHASPSAIMEFMHPNPNITSERVKSHLQKYRKNRDKSRKEFMTSYENSLQGFKIVQEKISMMTRVRIGEDSLVVRLQLIAPISCHRREE